MDTCSGLPFTMFRCFFHLSWGVQIYLNFECSWPRPVTALNMFM